jgi:hypothetical protein
MRREFLGNVAKNDAKAVKAFVSGNSENALKVRPKVRSLLFLQCLLDVRDATLCPRPLTGRPSIAVAVVKFANGITRHAVVHQRVDYCLCELVCRS